MLTHLLLPLLKKSAPARIVNVSSLGQEAIDFNDVMMTNDYSGMRAYRQSKLAQILFTIDLAPELAGGGVTVNALHPATFMNTNMVRQFGTPMTTVEEGADAILKQAIAPEMEGRSGLFFNGQREAQSGCASLRSRGQTASSKRSVWNWLVWSRQKPANRVLVFGPSEHDLLQLRFFRSEEQEMKRIPNDACP